MHLNPNDDPKRESKILNESEYNSFGKTDLNNINNNYSNSNEINQPLDNVTLLDRESSSCNPRNKYDEVVLNEAGSDKETESSCINYIHKIIDNMGFNNYFILNLVGTGFSFLGEGSQNFIISVLNPIFKQLFDKKIYGDFLINFISSSYFISFLIGCLLNSFVSKKFNRRKPIIFFNLLIIFLAFMLISYENIYWIICIRLLSGVCYSLAICLSLTNFSETIPSMEREINVISTHFFFRMGILYTIALFQFIIPTFNVAYWKHFFIFSIIPNLVSLFINYFYLVESPKFLFYKKNIHGAVNSLVEMSKYQNTKIKMTEDDINELRSLFYSENPICYDGSQEIQVDVIKLSNHKNSNYQSLTNQEIKSFENVNNFTIAEVKILHENKMQNDSESEFRFFDIFKKRNIIVTCISSSLFTLAAVISNCNIYYLPIVLFKISEENKTRDLFNNQTESLSNTDPKKNLVKGTKLDGNFTLIFFFTQIVTLFALVLSVFLAKKIGRKLTIGLNFIPCIIAGFLSCFLKSMILPSTAIINFFVVISLVTSKLFIMEAFNTKLRDAGFGFAQFCKAFLDSFVPFFINNLIEHGILVPMYLITALSSIAFIISFFIPSKHDGMHIK